MQGDGIGPEIVNSAIDVIDLLKDRFNLNIELIYSEIGFSKHDVFKEPWDTASKSYFYGINIQKEGYDDWC